MSYQIGIDTIRLTPASRLAHTEYCDHEPFMGLVAQRTGKPFMQAWEYDMIWHTEHGPIDWASRGRVTDMGHATFMEGGKDFRQPKPCPFADAQQVLAFDAVREYGPITVEELVPDYQRSIRDRTETNPDSVNMGGYYRTIVSGAIEAFGWDMLLTAAADPDAFENVLDSFFRLAMIHVQAWARTSAEVFMCHDDMVWTSGPFMDPGFYRRAIFPRYAQLWKVLRDAGKKVLYTSDGDYLMFLDDLVAAGADGFVFEPVMPLKQVVAKVGKTHVIAGSCVDCRTLTFGTQKQIQKEIDATLELAFDCPGFFFAVGNHLPVNIPIERLLYYFEYLSHNWFR